MNNVSGTIYRAELKLQQIQSSFCHVNYEWTRSTTVNTSHGIFFAIRSFNRYEARSKLFIDLGLQLCIDCYYAHHTTHMTAF